VLFFLWVPVALLFSFLCWDFGGVHVAHLFSCCVVLFDGVPVAHLFSFLCCVFGGFRLLIFLVFCVGILVVSMLLIFLKQNTKS
jgi:H+/gluconate symporter-like permease